MAHTQLSRTPSGAGNRKTFTIAVWVKRSELATENLLLKIDGGTNNTNYIEMKFDSGDRLLMGGYTSNFLRTNRLFRDPNAWYHIVWRVDTTQSTADDRVRLYVNGVQETSFGQRNNPGQNDDMAVNSTTSTILGSTLNGYLAQYIIADGQSYAATTFGSTDANGVWITNPGPSVSYGTNGFKLDFKGTGTSADTSGFGADTSGNNNHFATTNLGTNPSTKDSPTNNFAVINAAANYYAGATLSEGATKITTDGANYTYNISSIGVSAGKWYIEDKIGAGINNWFGVGIAEGESSNASGVLGRDTYYPAGNEFGQIGWYGYGSDFVYQNDGYYSGSTSDYDTSGYTTGDVLGLALDADNNTVKFYKNGTVQNSGNAFNLGASSTGFWHFAFGDYDGQNAGSHTHQVNFGNPAFTIASSNADANGYGSFEYAVPSGYYALCTKNLATYG